MQALNLKHTHKPVKAYYESLQKFEQRGVTHEMAVKTAFGNLLDSACQKVGWVLVPEYKIKLAKDKFIRVDGALLDKVYPLPYGYWEAKDSHDNLEKEVKRKFQAGYPKDNMLFQAPERATLWQDGKQADDADITKAENLIDIVGRFFAYRPPAYEQWEEATAKFGEKVPQLADALVETIAKERKTNLRFIQAFSDFTALCRQSINPNLSEAAVEEMLIQHLLTERIFRTIFSNPDFTRRNAIAIEIEKLIDALTSKSFSRQAFLKNLDHFYKAIEETAATIKDFSQKQQFLNTVYEKFFQGFSVKVADTHGIVYTPQPIVNFMVKSVEDILQTEFGKSLSDKGVHILDPFVGTGNFIVRVMQEIRKTALSYKYEHELHCNEVMLSPYYIASMNIEHEFLELARSYQPFEGVCLVDTFADEKEQQLDLFTPENTSRVNKQRQSSIYVVIGNPPYNASQVNENDNNKNRKYKALDKRVAETYARNSKATNKNALFDPYVKAIRWASDRISEDGIVALVTNNSFVNDIAFDGMRKNLQRDFDAIYILDLAGNVRKNPKLSGTTHNVFGIQVGVSISLFVRKNHQQSRKAEIYYARVDEFWRKQEKYSYLDKAQQRSNINWQLIEPNQKYTWLTQELEDDFEFFIPIGDKETKGTLTANTIFINYSMGISTNRDNWAYNYNKEELINNIQLTMNTYNEQVYRWKPQKKLNDTIDSFVLYDDQKIKWSSRLKECLAANISANFEIENVRKSLYQPFVTQYLYFDKILTHRRGQFPSILPNPDTENENQVICITDIGSEKPFMTLLSNKIADLHLSSPGCGTQCFPFYTYEEDGSNRRENITDWVLEQFCNRYQDKTITKWDIFHYTYAILHHPVYRDRYAANLKRELLRIPYTSDFYAFAKAGKRLASIHVNYEQQPEYPLKFIENKDIPRKLRVEKMKLTQDKTAIVYNDFLTISGIPKETFDYRLGNRSALDWIIDQYQVTTDKRSGIVNDPNRLDDEQYIVRFIGQIITVSLETVQIVNTLPSLGILLPPLFFASLRLIKK